MYCESMYICGVPILMDFLVDLKTSNLKIHKLMTVILVPFYCSWIPAVFLWCFSQNVGKYFCSKGGKFQVGRHNFWKPGKEDSEMFLETWFLSLVLCSLLGNVFFFWQVVTEWILGVCISLYGIDFQLWIGIQSLNQSVQWFDGSMTVEWLTIDGSVTNDQWPIWSQFCFVKWWMIY